MTPRLVTVHLPDHRTVLTSLDVMPKEGTLWRTLGHDWLVVHVEEADDMPTVTLAVAVQDIGVAERPTEAR